MAFHSKLIFILIFTSIVFTSTLVESENEDQAELEMMCFIEVPDVVVVLDDGDIYLFFYKWFWELYFNETLMDIQVVSRSARLISKDWGHLPNHIETGFTVEKSDTPNPIAGHTFFVKGEQYFEFQNRTHIKNGSTKYWGSDKWKRLRFVATLKNSSLVLIAKSGQVPGLFSSGQTYIFDDPSFPEKLNSFQIVSKYFEGIDWKKLKFLIPLSYKEAFLAVFDFGTGGGFYCVLKHLQSKCNYKPIHQIFNCSDKVLLFKMENLVYKLWNITGLNVHEILIVISGGSLATLFINLLLISISIIRYIQLN